MYYSPEFRNLVRLIRTHRDQVAAVVIHINDTYVLDQRGPRRLPGFPRLIATVRVLRRHVQKATGEDRLLFVHSGDFLGPSRIGRRDKGRAMVELLNRGGLNYCVLGNHEFDHGEDELIGRLGEAHFKVLAGNVTPPASIPHQRFAFWPSGKEPRVALTGIVSKSVHDSFGPWGFSDPAASLKQFEKDTQHVPFRIVLTHALREEDRAIRKALADASRCIILGGHDHDIDWIEADQTPPLYKNLSNLESIRVFVLLAGADAGMIALNKSYRALKKRLGSEPLFTPENVDHLLKPVLRPDADIFRRFIDGTRWMPNVSPVGLRYFTDDEADEVPRNALVRKLVGLSWLVDFKPYRLVYRDFAGPVRADDDFVRDRLAKLRTHNETRVIRDFAKDAEFLEARDGTLRAGATDFGMFVAECVRREAGADVAILNSGSFRCDAKLPVKLRERDLRDTFLYDDYAETNRDDRAVIVLPMPSAHVDALTAFGKQKVNSGAYPQVADARTTKTKEAIVAISGYVLLDDRSLDPYISVLAGLLARSEASARDYVRQHIAKRVTIVSAILNQGPRVAYRKPTEDAAPSDDASVFIALAWEASLRFAQGPGRHHPRPAVWNEAFMDAIGKDETISDKRFQEARDKLRGFLKRLLGTRGAAENRGQLFRLHQAIRSHQRTFRDGLAYYAMLKPAVRGMIDWRPD